ncbi:MAG TPA: pantetheine-phosphate adenylyltransferase [Verrucomicrobiae bacterium]|nr:pantetheine-phosphate adenylyltransferase [Verrucomicrobiae bacterium]
MAIKKRPGLAVYAGSFDPLTIGHVWMIEEGCRIFQKLHVAVGINPEKKYYFTLEDRVEMLRASTRNYRNVTIGTFSNLYLVDYAQATGATHILRGIRSQSDYEFERTMRNINGDFEPGITTVFLMPPRNIAEVSSSMVKGLIGPKGWERIVKRYVPGPVYERLRGDRA